MTGISADVGTPETSTTASGTSRTSVQTVFKKASGDTILTANFAITTASDELKATSGSSFDTTVSVDVTLALLDTAYTNYAYSLDITGLPDWLKVSGEIVSSDTPVKGAYHHEFTLTGTPTASSDAVTLTFRAVVKLSGALASYDLTCSADKTITLTTSSSDISDNPSEDVGADPSGEDVSDNSRTPSSGQNDPYYDPYADYETPSNVNSETPADTGSNTETPSDTGGNNEAPADTGSNTQTPSNTGGNTGNDAPANSGGDTELPADTSNDTPSDSGDSGSGDSGENTGPISNFDDGLAPIPTAELLTIPDEEIINRFEDKTKLELVGDVQNLSETITRIESLTGITSLDLSQVSGVSTFKLENTKLESITLEGNQSITTVEVTGSTTLTTLNLAGSSVETVNVEGCSSLTTLNVAGAQNLTTLNVKATNLTELDVNGCVKLEILDAKGSKALEAVNLEGCDSLQSIDVSETAITELNVMGRVQLGALYCASCSLDILEVAGCDNLRYVDCSNNRLTMLDASEFYNLRGLECRNQQSIKPLSRVVNFIDLLLELGQFAAAAEDGNRAEILVNVKNLKAYDMSGNELSAELNTESGEAVFGGDPAKIEYDYVTGFGDVMMDVEVLNSELQDEDTPLNDPGPGDGGCTSGFGLGALGVIVLLLALGRRNAA